MARNRTIKPTFWSDGKIGKLSHVERLLFIGLWNFADDEGKLADNPDEIRAWIFPYEPTLDVNAMLSDIAVMGMLVRYSAEGKKYLKILKFLKHQSIERPAKSRIPDLLDDVRQVLDEKPSFSPKGIVLIYHEILPELPAVRGLSETISIQLKGRSKEYVQTGAGELTWWREYFSKIRESPFLMGDNDRGWRPGLLWLTGKKNMAKVINGEYGRKDDRERLGPGASAFSKVARSVRERKGGKDLPDPSPPSGSVS